MSATQTMMSVVVAPIQIAEAMAAMWTKKNGMLVSLSI